MSEDLTSVESILNGGKPEDVAAAYNHTTALLKQAEADKAIDVPTKEEEAAIKELTMAQLLGGKPEVVHEKGVATTTNKVSTKVFDNLDESSQKLAKTMASKLDLTKREDILNYGVNAQQSITAYASKYNKEHNVSDIKPVSEEMKNMLVVINDNSVAKLSQSNNPFKRLFGKAKRSVLDMKADFTSVSGLVTTASTNLMNQRSGIINDITMLDGLFDQNMQYYEALNILVGGGQLKLKELVEEIVPKAIEIANRTGDAGDAQAVSDLQATVDRLDSRLADLQNTRQVVMQQAFQIRLIQQTDEKLAEKIQSTVNTIVPLWQTQFAIMLATLNAKDSQEVIELTSETTRSLLRTNAELMGQVAVEVAEANNETVIDIDTLEYTQGLLVDSIKTVLSIQKDGFNKRRESEVRMEALEADMKKSILELNAEGAKMYLGNSN